MLKKFLEVNLTASEGNHKNSDEVITDNCLIITNNNSKQKMKFGQKFESMLDQRDVLLWHEFCFRVDIDLK